VDSDLHQLVIEIVGVLAMGAADVDLVLSEARQSSSLEPGQAGEAGVASGVQDSSPQLLGPTHSPGPEHDDQRSDGNPVTGRLATADDLAAHAELGQLAAADHQRLPVSELAEAGSVEPVSAARHLRRLQDRGSSSGPAVHSLARRPSGSEGSPEARRPEGEGGWLVGLAGQRVRR
jgi:hypothetical protein